MKTLNINKIAGVGSIVQVLCGAVVCALLWYLLPIAIQGYNGTAGIIDSGIWLLLLFAVVSFVSLAILCGWLLKYFLAQLGLPQVKQMVLQFNKLELWQQFAFNWASFALLLFVAVLSLVAVF